MTIKLSIKRLEQEKIDELAKQLYDELDIKTELSTLMNEDLNSITALHNQQNKNLYNDFAKN